MNDLSNYRRSYEKSQLLEENLPDNPIMLFKSWFLETESIGLQSEVNAMTISSIGADGFPKNRVVLLKKYNEEGFIFFTNYNSEKGKAIAANPHVCLSFFWGEAERQVIIKGKAEKVPENISDGYFETRPEGSRIGAIVSPQSEVIPSRGYLEERLAETEKRYAGKEIPRPAYWGGYIVKPVEMEFWQGRPNRLHDRIRYRLQDDYNWQTERLAP
ncbi:pyridoxamine 5'-phosphate oxidase [Flavobacterium cyanobacteriorum]|uniref:Pyridoxine/pyridoxamine 5'-phosphate oxidase n=1 Tax=Flavobacterium cyanobacteriorum TaxID=2022802 RepID=A0A255ZA18_9FLAO|nr:pyridoxamine 5'-phosphate oxidase [Flavobacterium cyanobacteriorum]OYQ38299.1 pyridoxamine 5'-phosphate oxidase [Flavobacterium cyanobacteriorum]